VDDTPAATLESLPAPVWPGWPSLRTTTPYTLENGMARGRPLVYRLTQSLSSCMVISYTTRERRMIPVGTKVQVVTKGGGCAATSAPW